MEEKTRRKTKQKLNFKINPGCFVCNIFFKHLFQNKLISSLNISIGRPLVEHLSFYTFNTCTNSEILDMLLNHWLFKYSWDHERRQRSTTTRSWRRSLPVTRRCAESPDTDTSPRWSTMANWSSDRSSSHRNASMCTVRILDYSIWGLCAKLL